MSFTRSISTNIFHPIVRAFEKCAPQRSACLPFQAYANRPFHSSAMPRLHPIRKEDMSLRFEAHKVSDLYFKHNCYASIDRGPYKSSAGFDILFKLEQTAFKRRVFAGFDKRKGI